MPNNKTPSKRKKKAFTLIECLIFAFIISFIIVLFAAMVADDINKSISDLQTTVEQYHETIEKYANE